MDLNHYGHLLSCADELIQYFQDIGKEDSEHCMYIKGVKRYIKNDLDKSIVTYCESDYVPHEWV